MASGSHPSAPLRTRGRLASLLLVGGLVLATVAVGSIPAPAAVKGSTKPAVCKQAAAFHSALAAIEDLSAPRIPAAARALHPAMIQFRSAAGRAPVEVRAAWKAMSGALARIDAALQKTVTTKGIDKGRTLDALYALMRTLDADPTLNGAAKTIDAWLDSACGLTPHYLVTTTVSPRSAAVGSSSTRG